MTHGTSTFYKAGCRCFRCRQAQSRINAKRYVERRKGRPGRVDSTRAIKHYRAWKKATKAGMYVFAREAGVSPRTIGAIASGHRPRITADTERRMLSVKIQRTTLPDRDERPATGTRRRVEALCAIGYSITRQAQMVGMQDSNLRKAIAGTNLHEVTYKRIMDLYDELSMTPAPDSVSSRMALRYAARKGYAPPLAWEDGEIDNPKARPRGVAKLGHITPRKPDHECAECPRCGVRRQVRSRARGELCPDCKSAERESA